MKHSKKLRTIVFLICLVSIQAFAADDGVEQLRAVESKIKNVDLKNATKKAEFLDLAADAVEKLPTGPKKKLDAYQVKELVELLRLTDDFDFFHKIVEHNSDLIRHNNAAIQIQLDKLAPKTAKAIRDTIHIVLSEDEPTDP